MSEPSFYKHKDGRNNFTQVSNVALRDVNLSNAAKGLISYLISLPDDWDLSFAELLKHSTDGRKALSSQINELIKAGYMKRYQTRTKQGFGAVRYEFYDMPVFLDASQAQNVQAQNVQAQNVQAQNVQAQKVQQLIYNINNTEKNNTDFTNMRGPQKNFCEPHAQQTDQKDLFSDLDNSQEYVWVNSPEVEEKESSGKEKEVKERKTLFENSDYCKELSQKSEEEREKILEKDFPDLKEINIDLLYYFEVVRDWSNSSNTKRTARGWKSTIRNFVRGDKEKNKVHFKINPQEPQQTDGGLTDEQRWFLNLGNV